MSAPKISVIIVNFNGGEWLQRCVNSIRAQSFTDFECFIVDNNSTDDSLDTLPKLDPRFHIIALDENAGFAKGNNIAAHKARGEWLALLNPDAFARPNWLDALLSATQIAPNVTMVGSTQYMALEPDIFDGLGDYYHISGLAWRAGFGHSVHPVTSREAFGPCGAGAFYHTDTFLRLGGFDERFFCYHEDVDMAYRLRLYGGVCIQSRDAVIDHVSSGISGRASEFAVYYGTRNRIWTFFKNTPTPLLLPLVPLHVALNLSFLIWSGFRLKRLRPTLRGIRHGFGGLWPILRSRKQVQAMRRISSLNMLKAFAYSPKKVIRRDIPNVQSFEKPDNPPL